MSVGVWGSALQAFVRLKPRSAEIELAILELLGLRTRPGAGRAATPAFRAEREEPASPPLTEPGQSPQLREVDDPRSLPPLVNSSLTQQGEAGATAAPSWLESTPPIALPASIPNPFRQAMPPLFDSKYQSAIVSRLACVNLPVGEPDILRVIECIARGMPFESLPRRPVITAAKGLQLLIDNSASMEPFRLDAAALVGRVRRTIGADRVSVQVFRGLPEWGVSVGTEHRDYRTPAADVPVMIVSDLGLRPRDRMGSPATRLEWERFLSRLNRSSHPCTIIVPRDGRELPEQLRRYAKLVPWDRHTLASLLDQPRASFTQESDVPDSGGAIVPFRSLKNIDADLIELALPASLAVRIEPQLLRTLRLSLTPHLSVDHEVKLWFSDAVAERAPTGILLKVETREVLRRLLRSRRELLDRAYVIVESLHRDAAPALRIEEELTYRWLTGDIEGSRALLRQLVSTLVAPQRSGLSRWASQAIVRLPRDVLSLEEARMLCVGTALRTGELATLEGTSAGDRSSWNWLRPTAREIEIGINLREGLIEFGPRSIQAAHRMTVPDTNPIVVEIAGLGHRVQRVKLNPTQRSVVEVEGRLFQIGVLGGARWTLSAAAKQSSQRFIARNRASRVHIQYDMEIASALKKIELPFIFAVMADLAGYAPLPSLNDRKLLEIDIDNFDHRLKGLSPALKFVVPDVISKHGELSVDLVFEQLQDFEPAAVVRRVPALGHLLEARTLLENMLRSIDGRDDAEQALGQVLMDPEILHALVEEYDGPALPGWPLPRRSARSFEPNFDLVVKFERAVRPRTEEAERRLRRDLQVLAYLWLEEQRDLNGTIQGIQSWVATLDGQLTRQLNAIFNHSEFRALEGAWRGLNYLVSQAETNEMLKIRFLPLSKQELAKTLQRHSSDMSTGPLFKLLYENEYGTFGGEPYGCLIGDYYFDHSAVDVQTLQEIAKIAAAAHCPFISGASPALMDIDSWQELANPRDIHRRFQLPEYAPWRALRDSDHARYLCLTMPRFLARLPYGAKTIPVEEFEFEEDTLNFTWANSAFAMGANIARAFTLYGWCARIRGVESGGAIESLPVYTFPTDDGGLDQKCPTEIAITDRREVELSSCGIAPLIHRKNSDSAVFVSVNSLRQPVVYDDPDATAEARLAVRLPYLFAGCRFAQYIKCLVRDRSGAFTERGDLQRYLQDWLLNYVDADPSNSSEELKARKPLAGAEIIVDDVPGNPERRVGKLYLRPHYQLEGNFSMRLLIEMPAQQP